MEVTHSSERRVIKVCNSHTHHKSTNLVRYKITNLAKIEAIPTYSAKI